MMKFRKTVKEDIEGIMRMIHQAQAYMKAQNIDQWQDGYPNEETFQKDISRGWSYVLEDGGKLLGTIAVIFDGEPDYDNIYEGSWKTDGASYGAIHRVAVDEELKGRGIAGRMISEAEKLCREHGIRSMRNDTHRDNHSMQRMLAKNGFEYCGIIYLKDGAERIAFEKQW